MSDTDSLREMPAPYGNLELAPADASDPLLDAFKADVDRTLLRANLALTPEQRSRKFESFMESIYQMRGAANPNGKVWR